MTSITIIFDQKFDTHSIYFSPSFQISNSPAVG
jgi:hypothetical protein